MLDIRPFSLSVRSVSSVVALFWSQTCSEPALYNATTGFKMSQTISQKISRTAHRPAADLGGARIDFNSFLLNRAIPPGVIARQSKAWGSITWTWNGMLEQAPVTEGRRGAAEFRVSREWADPLSRSVQPDSSRCPIWTTCPVQTDRTDSPYLAAMGCPS
jgi:hypothetical protein